jgi:hypothetical protein
MNVWWIPNAVIVVAGLAIVGLGVYDHDNQALMLVGTGLVSAAAGHMVGKQSPTP